MSLHERPESVLERTTRHLGHNCVACVAAVLYNALGPRGFATANRVAAQYQIAPASYLPPARAVRIFQEFTGVTPSAGNPLPWERDAPDGHYAVFCLGRWHVIYGYRETPGYYLYDPQLERDQHWPVLVAQGFGPFEGYHFP
jgi:hypothetical protein